MREYDVEAPKEFIQNTKESYKHETRKKIPSRKAKINMGANE